NCGSTKVAIIEQGCDLDPFVAYRVFGLRTAGRTTSTRLKAGNKLKIIDRLLLGSLSHLAKFCIETDVSAWTVTDAIICNSCEFYSVYHPLTDSMLASMYHDYRSNTYLQDWEEFHPGYIAAVGRYIGGNDEARQRLVSMNAYLHRMDVENIVETSGIKSILDWGGADGLMLPDVFDQAVRYVYDISDKTPVEAVTKLNTVPPGATFDYIQITHVLEHVFHPLDFLQAPIAHLAPHGILYLEVPLECEANGLLDKVLSHERRLWAHEHINLFTPRSLRSLVETSGLRVLDLTLETIDFFWCKGPCLRLLATPSPSP
ncbi:MAG: class I SAM-dependent methyltransferase, partial [Cyanobacteriota bacterium]|nr:class I SAM-dependent methyltransferase [Cyanobacteriota bacterium]